MDTKKFENTYEKPIYLVKLFSVFMLADFCTGILYKMNLLELINLEKIQADKVLSATFCTLVACFVIKVLLGACGKKIFLRYGNYLVYNKEDISNTVELWLKESYKANDQYAINKCSSLKKSIETEENCFTDIFINIIIFAAYLCYSLKLKISTLAFISLQPIHFILMIGYFLVLAIIIYSLFNKKEKHIIDL